MEQFPVRIQFWIGDSANVQFELVPEWWSDMAVGGPDMAQIRVEGHHETIGESLKALGRAVEIFSPLGARVWWGHVHAVDAAFGGATISLSLDDVYNAVAVAYIHTGADGNIERRTTDFATDAQSIDLYGRREVLLSMTQGDETEAEKYRDRFLAKSRFPVPATRLGGDSHVHAVLQCRGNWHWLARRYFVEPRGLVEFTQSGAGVQGLGNSYAPGDTLTATTISFEAPNIVRDSGNGFTFLAAGDFFFVSGSSEGANNTVHVVDTVSAGEITTTGSSIVTSAAGPSVSIFSGTISFEAPNIIRDSANGLGVLEEGDRILVAGSALVENNDWHTVDAIINAGEIETVGQNIETSAEGAAVTLAMTSGAAATVAQGFKIPAGVSSWDARRVAVQVRRVGSPGDNLHIDIRSDSAGEPVWPPLATATIAGSTLSTGLSWVEAPLDSAVSLFIGTQYWISVRRSGSASLKDHYAVNVTEDLGYGDGDLLLNRDAAWVARDPDAQMPFRITGLVETTTQMQTMIQASDLAGVDFQIASGIETWQLREGDRLIVDELNDLLGIGTDDGKRLLATVQPGPGQVLIRAQLEQETQFTYLMDADGHIRTAAGQNPEPGELIAGRWVELEFLPILDAVQPAGMLFIERSRYEARSGQLSVESAGTESIWRIGVLPG